MTDKPRFTTELSLSLSAADFLKFLFSWSRVARVTVDGLNRGATNCQNVAQRRLRLVVFVCAEGKASGSNWFKVKTTHLK